MPLVMPGSFSAVGAMNPVGYHEPPAASGAMNVTRGVANSGASVRILPGDAFRPCTMMTTT